MNALFENVQFFQFVPPIRTHGPKKTCGKNLGKGLCTDIILEGTPWECGGRVLWVLEHPAEMGPQRVQGAANGDRFGVPLAGVRDRLGALPHPGDLLRHLGGGGCCPFEPLSYEEFRR